MGTYVRFLKEYLIGFKYKYLIAFIIIILQNVIMVYTPLIYSKIIDNTLLQKNKEQFISLVFLMVFISIAGYGFGFLKSYILALNWNSPVPVSWIWLGKIQE